MSGPERPWRVLALSPAPEGLLERLLSGLPVVVDRPAERTQEAVRAALAEAEIVIGDWSSQLALGAAEVAAAPRLAFVQQAAVGVDPIDLAATAAGGVPVANTAGSNTVSVAEWCLAATLALLRRLLDADAAVRAGQWPQTTLGVRELAGTRVGLLGMGAIGAATAERLRAFGAQVAYWSRRERPAGSVAARWLALEQLFAFSEVLVVVIALGPQTRGLVGAEALAALPQGALVVDASRGGVVQVDALVEALRSGHLGGAAVDVHPVEPLPADSPLRSAPGVLLSPHLAGASVPAQLRLLAAVRDNIERALGGQPVVHVCNGVDPLVRRR